jgi:hypothetical protein
LLNLAPNSCPRCGFSPGAEIRPGDVIGADHEDEHEVVHTVNECLPKTLKKHGQSLALCFFSYDFCGVHKTLGATAAMAAGVTDREHKGGRLREAVEAANPVPLSPGLTKRAKRQKNQTDAPPMHKAAGDFSTGNKGVLADFMNKSFHCFSTPFSIQI